MKQIMIKKNCIIKGKEYVKGKVFKPKKEDMLLVMRLNEKGFIEPLTKEQLLELSSSFILKKKKKEEI